MARRPIEPVHRILWQTGPSSCAPRCAQLTRQCLQSGADWFSSAIPVQSAASSAIFHPGISAVLTRPHFGALSQSARAMDFQLVNVSILLPGIDRMSPSAGLGKLTILIQSIYGTTWRYGIHQGVIWPPSDPTTMARCRTVIRNERERDLRWFVFPRSCQGPVC
jgi:hypothetical protein